ncbi:MAG: BrnA antitoxin family protein, partial [Xanthobacteraceae bacterium]|nr:BrnA antitoxin family protein [Xanthobacteraceae bacterium]
DPDDAPELTEEFFYRADWYQGDNLIRRGRPAGAVAKRPVTIRLDTDVIAHFQAGGRGWQSRINKTLRKAAKLRRA